MRRAGGGRGDLGGLAGLRLQGIGASGEYLSLTMAGRWIVSCMPTRLCPSLLVRGGCVPVFW